MTTWQIHITWEEPAPPGLYTERNHQGPTPTITYAETLGPYVNRADAEANLRRAQTTRPHAQAEIVTLTSPRP